MVDSEKDLNELNKNMLCIGDRVPAPYLDSIIGTILFSSLYNKVSCDI